ncbi:MAG: LPS export ABC transporter permease LptF [Deltaproteobacteria bacterium]|nr:LPS export ABC transporter permease LptF [Deltaproteobacteria bacterium]
MTRLINRYIVKEIAFPFGMILFVLTFVLLMGKILQLMDLMINKGVSFSDIALLMFYLMPSFLMFTLPISLLIAILMGLGRLTGDNEITVMKMSGISLYQLAVPVMGAAVAVFLLTAVTTLFLVPHGNLASRTLLFDMAKQKASVGIREKVFIDDFRGILLYVEKIPLNGDYLEGVLIRDNRISQEPSTIFAHKARLVSDPDTLAITLRLENGSTHTVDSSFNHYRKMDFQSYDIRLDLTPSFADPKKSGTKSSTEMTVSELMGKIKNQGVTDEAIREMAIELNKKLTIPVSCLVFAILGVPLGIRGSHRAIRSRGFSIGLAIVLIYYLMRLSGEALVETGRLAPFIGAWAPNAFFGIAGGLLFYCAAREIAPGTLLRSLFPRRDKASGDGDDPAERRR